MTISPKSRFYGACVNLPESQRTSTVRKAIAISCLRTFSNMELALKSYLTFSSSENQLFDWDETTAGFLASSMKPAMGRYPAEIGNAILESGLLQPKLIKSNVIDIIYENSQETNDLNNELVYLFGHQLEHLFDPLAEYSPEHTEMLYTPPSYQPLPRSSDNETVQHIYQELFNIQYHFTTNLLNLLQDYLIPLRVKVLSGEIPGMNMRKLNAIFPPTIDEIVRVNNILYEALAMALPYGSYEVVKACGISIPYFYKACMRHEAATRNFRANLRENLDTIQTYGSVSPKFTVNNIESTIHCSLHLTKIKLVLDRLVKAASWREDEKVNIEELYQSAVGTIDSFGRESFISPYNNRIFTPTGKLLVEISKGWPKELEYGWINRRVVTIFDAMDTMHGDQDVFSIVFVFTDSIVIIKPSEPVSITSDSGIHKPSIADILMHSMINSIPLPNLPELNVVGWAPIEDVYMAEFGGPMNLAMYVTGGGLNLGGNNVRHFTILKLIRPEMTANTIVNFASKAKIMNKTQPFHLFLNKQSDFCTFATVYEHEGYLMEPRKSPIAVYANMTIPESVLESHDLIACIGAQVYDRSHIAITVISKLAYSHREIVPNEAFSAALSTQVSRIYGLYFSSSNPFATEMIIKTNADIANQLIKFATTSKLETPKTHQASSHVRESAVTPPPLKHKPSLRPSLRQRVSIASSLFRNISQRPSQDLLREQPSQAPKKRFSFPFMPNREKAKLGNAERENKTMSSISLPIERISERHPDPQARYSFPSELPLSTASPSLQQAVPRGCQLSPKVQQVTTPRHLPPVTLSPAQQEQVVRRKTSFSATQSPSPMLPYVRSMHSNDVISIASSVVKDSERFWDSSSAVSVNVDPNSESTPRERFLETIPSESGSSGTVSSLGEPMHVSVGHSKTISESNQTSYTIDSVSGTHSSSLSDNFGHLPQSSIGQSSLDESSSVENWYNELSASIAIHRAESLNSLDTHPESGTDCTLETTIDDDDDLEDLAMSLKNITSFIDDTYSIQSATQKPFQFPSKPPQLPELSSDSLMEPSILLEDDFSYLTSLVTSGDQPHITPSTSLYPTIRDSSLMFLSDYIHTRDESVCRFDHASITSIATPPTQQKKSVKPAVKHHHEASILSSEWKSISESYSFQSLAMSTQTRNSIRHVNASSQGKNVVTYSAPPTVEFSSEAKDALGPFPIIGQQSSRHAGGRRLSSLNSFANLTDAELLLRSLTVNVDSLINQECAELMCSRDLPTAANQRRARIMGLEFLNQTVLRLHQSTQGLSPLPAQITKLEAGDQARVVNVESANRKILITSLWSLIGSMEESRTVDESQYNRYREVFTGFLDLEWQRRSIMHEKLGTAMPKKIWNA